MATKKPRGKIRTRLSEPSSMAGIGLIAGVALPGLLTYMQTGSKTAGIAAILAALAGGGAVAIPEKKSDDSKDSAK